MPYRVNSCRSSVLLAAGTLRMLCLADALRADNVFSVITTVSSPSPESKSTEVEAADEAGCVLV